jgi:hypothetical protein
VRQAAATLHRQPAPRAAKPAGGGNKRGGEGVLSGMFPANSHLIRPATADDALALRRLAAVSHAAPLAGRILVAEQAGAIVAALSLAEDRTVADPVLAPPYVATLLRLRAEGIEAYELEPRLAERIRAAVLGPRRDELAQAA